MNTVSRRKVLAATSAALPFLLLSRVAAAAVEHFEIATGEYGGIYFPLGNSICRLLNRDSGDAGSTCSGEASAGSVANIAALRDATSAAALIQSDVVQAAQAATGVFAGTSPFDSLRVVCRAHAEPFTVLASRKSAIQGLDDLPGKRIGIGILATGQRATVDTLARDLGWSPESFSSVLELESGAEISALCDDRVDAILLQVGHPSGWIQEATLACDARLVPVTGPKIDAIIAKYPYYEKVPIPGGLYRDHPADIPSFGTRALLVTTAKAPDQLAYALAAAVFENFEVLTQLVPALATLDAETAMPTGVPAPTHSGAEQYFRERGML